MTSQPGQQTITVNIFPNISQSKGNQPGNEICSANRI